MYKTIIVPVDLDDKQSIKAIFPPALNFVNAFDSELHLVHIIPDFGIKLVEDYLPKNWINDQRKKCNEQLQNLIKKYIPQEIKTKQYVGRGAVYDEIINYSKETDADLIIISAVRPQLRDYMLGPNASKIVRHSSISVLVVRED